MTKAIALVFALLPLFALSHPAAAAPAKITVAGDCQEPWEAETVHLVNNFRVENGLNRLYSADLLSASSEHMSQDMSHYGWAAFAPHYLHDGTSFGDNIRNHGEPVGVWLGENIGASQSSPTAIVEAWKNSPPHRALMLDGNARAIGVGYAVNWNDPGDPPYYRYWTADLSSYYDAPANLC